MNLVLQTNSIWHDLTHFPLYDREVRSRRRSLTYRTKSWISSKTRISTCHVTGQLRFCKLRGLVLRKSRFHLRDRAPTRSEQLAFSVFISSSRWTLLPMHSLSCCKAASPAPTTHTHTRTRMHTHTWIFVCTHSIATLSLLLTQTTERSGRTSSRACLRVSLAGFSRQMVLILLLILISGWRL